MLTPAFEICQDENSITVIIKARLAKIAETEIFIEEDEFKFFSHPYFLRLTLPGKLVENGTESGKYDADNGQFVIRVPKQNPGEHFQDLDMLTTLLAPKKYPGTKRPLIEVLDSGNDDVNSSDDDDVIDWQIEQSTPSDDVTDPLSRDQYGYGFANQRSHGLPPRILEEYSEALDLREPEMTSPAERRRMRIEDEQEHFDPEHYLADLYQDETVEEWLNYDPACRREQRLQKQGQNPDKFIEFTEGEKDQLRKLPRKEYLITGDVTSAIYLGLVDLVYAYSYNERTTGGECHVESGWTVRKLSSTLSWFETFSSVKQVVKASMRRSLCYPLYRHWRLSQAVLRDTKYIFRLGKRRILRCLLELHNLLRERDPYFVLNDLYVDDYCVWLQGASDRKLAHLSRALDEIKVQKCDLDLELDDLERAAELAVEAAEESGESDDSESESDESETDVTEPETEVTEPETEVTGTKTQSEDLLEQLHNLSLVENGTTSRDKGRPPLVEEIVNDDVITSIDQS